MAGILLSKPHRIAALAMSALLLGSPMRPANAQKSDGSVPAASRMRLFNIPAQPLRSALEAYGSVTGYQIIYDSRLAEGRRSTAVVGLFAPDTALRMMLVGTDLAMRFSGPGDVTILSLAQLRAETARNAAADPDRPNGELMLDTLHVDVAPGAAARADFTAYGRTARTEIGRALRENDFTAHRIYQVQIDFWVDDKGKVRRPVLLRPAGQRVLDRAILDVIRAIVMREPPPAGMPQPIRVTIDSL